jgi:alkanesulfonate monooxygenase SsuD/methylene tetrahydromethanopterin reductase-like flavin-dependent oxidoreductase (luciferase family)
MIMDFGVVVSSSWSIKQISAAAMAAEEAGLDFLLVSDHYMTPMSNESVDTWTILAALAAKTQTIKLGTCVTPLPFRPPQMLAKIVATVDQLSNGRTILGVGAGWHRPEFEAYSEWDEGPVRVAKTREALQLITKLWTSKSPLDFEGKYYRVKGAVLEPKPVQRPHPPLWFGTTGSYMLKLAKKYADGWVPPVPGVTSETYRAVLSTLRDGSPKGGKKPIVLTFNGTLQQLGQMIPEFAEMGFDGAILARESPEETPTAISKLATEIIPSYRRH